MTLANNVVPLLFSSAAAEEDETLRSARFQADRLPSLTRGVKKTSNRRVFTVALWVKRGGVGSGEYGFYSAGNRQFLTGYLSIGFVDDHIRVRLTNGFTDGEDTADTEAVFADCASFYHIVLRMDSTRDDDLRMRLYVNGKETPFKPGTGIVTPGLFTRNNNANSFQLIGAVLDSSNNFSYFEGLIGDVHNIDGQSLEPTNFGRYINGVWQSKRYTGSYGPNGYHVLDFRRTPGDFGQDTSGRSNNFNVTSLSSFKGNGNWIKQISVTGGDRDYLPGLFDVPRMFDGATNTALLNGTNTSTTWEPSGGLSFDNKFEINAFSTRSLPTSIRFYWGTGPTDYYDYTIPSSSSGASPSFVDIASFLQSPITKVEWSTPSDAAGPFIYGVKVDDVQLVDKAFNTNDESFDVPINGSTSADQGNGGEANGNYCVYNPYDLSLKSETVFNACNLNTTLKSDENAIARGSLPHLTSGKWYWEVTWIDGVSATMGISDSTEQGLYVYGSHNSLVYRAKDGMVQGDLSGPGNTPTVFGIALKTYDVLGFALDMDAGNLKIYLNSLLISGTANTTSLAGKSVIPHLGHTKEDSGDFNAITNFGATPFRFPAPFGYKTINTTNLPSPPITNGREHFDCQLWVGEGANQKITSYEFSPSMVWIKNRDAKEGWYVSNTLMGTDLSLFVDTKNRSKVDEDDNVKQFTSNGFDFDNVFSKEVNLPNNNYLGVAWRFADTTIPLSGGDITAIGRVNQTAGASLLRYNGNGDITATVRHGLNDAPAMFWSKNISNGNNWVMWSTGITDVSAPTKVKTLALNDDGPFRVDDYSTSVTNPSNSTTITVSNASTDSDYRMNEEGDNYLACCFAPVKGYSSFGHYVVTTDTSEDELPFVLLDFQPALVIIKAQSEDISASKWYVFDNKRAGFNNDNYYLRLDRNQVEVKDEEMIQFHSNGFRLVTRKGVDISIEGTSYFWMAFASNPFAVNGGISR